MSPVANQQISEMGRKKVYILRELLKGKILIYLFEHLDKGLTLSFALEREQKS